MGYASNLKKIRKYSTLEVEKCLSQLERKELTNEEIFRICEDTLKLVEVHFKAGRKDSKLYNRYRNKIDEILHQRIFKLDLVKAKDRSSTKKTLLKKNNETLYVLLYTEFERLGFLHDTIKKNIMPSWLGKDIDKNGKILEVKSELNPQCQSIKGNEDKVLKHISNVYSYIKENELENDIRSNERYIMLSEIIDEKLQEMNSIKNETFEQSFYRYNFEVLKALYKDILIFSNYVNLYLPPIRKIYESEENK